MRQQNLDCDGIAVFIKNIPRLARHTPTFFLDGFTRLALSGRTFGWFRREAEKSMAYRWKCDKGFPSMR